MHRISRPIGVEDLDVRRVAVVLEDDLVGLVLRQAGHAKIRDLRDQRLHLQLPLPVQLVPVLEVVAGPPLEELGPLGDLGGVRHRVPGDVDVAVDDAVVDAHGGRNREHTVLPGGDSHVRDVRADEVECGHRQREVHRVPEPEALLVPAPDGARRRARSTGTSPPSPRSPAASRSRTGWGR